MGDDNYDRTSETDGEMDWRFAEKSQNGVISNKDIIAIISDNNLGEEELSELYEELHKKHLEINFDEEASDEDLEMLDSEDNSERKEVEKISAAPSHEGAVAIDDPVKCI